MPCRRPTGGLGGRADTPLSCRKRYSFEPFVPHAAGLGLETLDLDMLPDCRRFRTGLSHHNTVTVCEIHPNKQPAGTVFGLRTCTAAHRCVHFAPCDNRLTIRHLKQQDRHQQKSTADHKRGIGSRKPHPAVQLSGNFRTQSVDTFNHIWHIAQYARRGLTYLKVVLVSRPRTMISGAMRSRQPVAPALSSQRFDRLRSTHPRARSNA